MGWRDILRSPDPSRALYEAMRANPTASRAADAFQGGFEGVMGTGADILGALGHVAGAPTRAIAAAAGNAAGTGAPPVDVSDAALYGYDVNTGRQPLQYGDLLVGTLEDAGEVAPGSTASTMIRAAGNLVTDPMAAPLLLSGAEAVGALGGALTPSAAPMTPTMPRRPLASGPRGTTPTGPRPSPVNPNTLQQVPIQPGPGGAVAPAPPPGPPPPSPFMRGAPVTRPGGGPTQPVGGFGATQPVATQTLPPFNPTATQPVRPPGGGPQATQAFNPARTQPVATGPTSTQRVPQTRGPGGRGQLRPKAKRKSSSKKKED